MKCIAHLQKKVSYHKILFLFLEQSPVFRFSKYFYVYISFAKINKMRKPTELNSYDGVPKHFFK